MEDKYFNKTCTICTKPFRTLIEEYTTCIWCWYETTFRRIAPRALRKAAGAFSIYTRYPGSSN